MSSPSQPGMDFQRSLEPKKASKLSYKDQRDYELLPKKIEDLSAAIARDWQITRSALR